MGGVGSAHDVSVPGENGRTLERHSEGFVRIPGHRISSVGI